MKQLNKNERDVLAVLKAHDPEKKGMNAKAVACKLFNTASPNAQQIRAVRNAFRRPKDADVKMVKVVGRGLYTLFAAGAKALDGKLPVKAKKAAKPKAAKVKAKPKKVAKVKKVAAPKASKPKKAAKAKAPKAKPKNSEPKGVTKAKPLSKKKPPVGGGFRALGKLKTA